MYINCKTNTKKQKAYEFYNSFKWDKVSRPTFYQRVRLGWEDNWEEEIRVKTKNCNHKVARPAKWKRAVEINRYNEQPEPKASKTLFRNRLNGWYPKEEAVLMWERWAKVKEGKKSVKIQEYKPYIPPRIVKKEPDENDFKINITLSKEEARVFRKEYVKMIEQLEWELTYTEEKTEVAWLNEKLERLQNELQIFNSYNK